MINLGEGVEKREPFYTTNGNVNWCTHYGEWYGRQFLGESLIPQLVKNPPAVQETLV